MPAYQHPGIARECSWRIHGCSRCRSSASRIVRTNQSNINIPEVGYGSIDYSPSGVLSQYSVLPGTASVALDGDTRDGCMACVLPIRLTPSSGAFAKVDSVLYVIPPEPTIFISLLLHRLKVLWNWCIFPAGYPNSVLSSQSPLMQPCRRLLEKPCAE